MVTQIQKVLFVLLIIFLPTQLGYHWWPEWAFVNGIRVDYFAPTLYVTDILILLLVIFNIKLLITKKYLLVYCVTGLLALSNIYFSLSPAVSFYKWLKVAEMGFLVWYVARRGLQSADYRLLLIPVFYESVLAIWQFWQQSSVGGLWYWLGERTFSAATVGIAKANIDGILTLRPYGTLPHPNVLFGFLVISLLIIFPHISRRITAGVLVLAVFVLFLLPSRGNLLRGWEIRQEFNQAGLLQFTKSPVWGAGLGTAPLFGVKIANYALIYQPTHNIFLLILGELGVVGILGVVMILQKTKIHLPLIAVLVLGMFDHYFLTLQQGQLLLSLILGLSFRKAVIKDG